MKYIWPITWLPKISAHFALYLRN